MGARSRGRDRASRTQAPQWTPASIAGITALYDDSTLTASHVAGEGPYSSPSVAYPTISSWSPRAGSAPALVQATAGNRPYERGDIFEAKRRRGLFFDLSTNSGRSVRIQAATRETWDYQHDSTGSTTIVVCVPRAANTEWLTLAMTRGESAAAGAGIWLYAEGAGDVFGFYVANASAQQVCGITASSGGRQGVNIVSARMDPSSGGRARLRVNGGTETVASWTATPTARGVASAYPPSVGSSAQTLGAYAGPGDVLAVLTFSRCLSDAELALVEAYLSAQYVPATWVSSTTALSPALSSPLDVMIVHDSVGAGFNATGNIGYASLTQSGGSGAWVMVGPKFNGTAYTDSESGWCIYPSAGRSGHSPYGGSVGNLSTVLGSYDPDVIVIAAGYNDHNQPAIWGGPWSRNRGRDVYELVLAAAALKPNARFVICSPTPSLSSPTSKYVTTSRAGYAEIAAALSAARVPVVLRDWTTLVPAGQYDADNVHWNDTGHATAAADLQSALVLARG
jgi:hypothetical protein